MAGLVDLYNAQPVVIWDRPAALAVQMDPADDGLGWHIMAVNASLDPIEGAAPTDGVNRRVQFRLNG